MQPVTVSIIMGVYNAGSRQILADAVESIRSQTFTDWEWIICDDGSTDDTCRILQEFCKSDKRIHLIKNEKNQGLAAALNHCLAFAKGNYIARMDADDVSLPKRIEKEIKFLESHPEYHLTGTNASLFDEKGDWGLRRMPEIPVRQDFLWGSPFIHPTVIIRRDALMQVEGYRSAKETWRTEDYDLFMRLYAAGYRGYNIQETLYRFREDKEARKRKKYRYRLDEAKVRWNGFRLMGLMPKGILYVVKPLIVGLLPYALLVRLRGEKNKKEIV